MKYLRPSLDLTPDSVPVKASLGVHHGPSHVHQGPAEASTNSGLLCSSKQWPRAYHRQHLTLNCTRVPPKRPQNQHTWWQDLDHIRAQPNQLYKQHTQREIPGGNRLCWGKFQFVGSAPTEQSTVVRMDPHNRPGPGSTPPMERSTAIKTQL